LYLESLNISRDDGLRLDINDVLSTNRSILKWCAKRLFNVTLLFMIWL